MGGAYFTGGAALAGRLRGPVVGIFVVGLVVVGIVTIAGSAAKAPALDRGDVAGRAGSLQSTSLDDPPPTPTPQAPGINIASSKTIDLPDPFLFYSGGEYYMYLSTAFPDQNLNVPMLVGTPGRWWSQPVDALPQVPDWALPASSGTYVWDPDVVHLGDLYVMYFAATVRFDPTAVRPTHCIGVAVSSSPRGPFVPEIGPPIVCQENLGGDIDVQFFSDPNGPGGAAHPNYLIWKSDNNNLPGSGQSTVWAASLSDNGLSLTGNPVAIFTGDEPWEQPIVEAPQMVQAPDGTDWLVFSAGDGFFSPDYAMGMARCNGPLGGCHSITDTPLISSNSQGSGPGEETVFVGSDRSTWILYSPWHSGNPFALLRPVEAVRIGWNEQGPYVAEAGRFPTPA